MTFIICGKQKQILVWFFKCSFVFYGMIDEVKAFFEWFVKRSKSGGLTHTAGIPFQESGSGFHLSLGAAWILLKKDSPLGHAPSMKMTSSIDISHKLADIPLLASKKTWWNGRMCTNWSWWLNQKLHSELLKIQTDLATKRNFFKHAKKQTNKQTNKHRQNGK